MTGPLAIQEYIQEMIRANPSNPDKIIELPRDCDIFAWQYEHIRQFLIEINLLVTLLMDKCSKLTCPILTFKGQSYKCVVHEGSGECSAVDYMVHNLDNAMEIVLKKRKDCVKGGDGSPPKCIEDLHKILQRVYRILVHAVTSHRGVFEEFEKEMFLYARFEAFVRKFGVPNIQLISFSDQRTD